MSIYPLKSIAGTSITTVNQIINGTFAPTKMGEFSPNDGPLVFITADGDDSWEMDPPYDNLRGLSQSSSQPGSSTASQNGIAYFFRAYDIDESSLITFDGNLNALYRVDTQSE
jgi:hypothetical protein